ncbi:MAG: hypothetical protein IBJ14_15570 [Hydrogenophaga sp.]|nr:hypothetical protein [Hydrogenophaga sp.]
MKTATFLLAALALAGCAAPPPPPTTPPADTVACTQDVMQCPDGRFVGRRPPACAFDCGPPTAR